MPLAARSTLGATLLRGLAAGAVAGLITGLAALLFAEPTVAAAIALEPAGGEELLSRATQKTGLVLGLVLVGLALGALFALVYRAVPDDVRAGPWERSLVLALAGFTALHLVAFVRFPANPPGVGDEATLDERTSAYFMCLALGVLVVSGAFVGLRAMARRRPAVAAAERGVAGGCWSSASSTGCSRPRRRSVTSPPVSSGTSGSGPWPCRSCCTDCSARSSGGSHNEQRKDRAPVLHSARSGDLRDGGPTPALDGVRGAVAGADRLLRSRRAGRAGGHPAVQLMGSLDGVLELEVDGRAVRTTSVTIPAGARHSVRSVTASCRQPHG